MDGGGIIVGGDHGDGIASPVLLPEMVDSDAVLRSLRLRATVDGALRHVAEKAASESEHLRRRELEMDQLSNVLS